MSKDEIISAICVQNPSARPHFLAAFCEQSLESYLKRLTQINGRRGPGSSWVREGDTPAIVASIAILN
jgi:hypothetical protein